VKPFPPFIYAQKDEPTCLTLFSQIKNCFHLKYIEIRLIIAFEVLSDLNLRLIILILKDTNSVNVSS